MTKLFGKLIALVFGSDTVTVTVGGVLVSTKTVTFFGKVTKITATGVLTNAAAAGAALGNPAAARTASTIIPAIIVKATDSALNPVSGLVFTYKTSSASVMTETLTCNELRWIRFL